VTSTRPTVRIAAVGDVHVGDDSRGRLGACLVDTGTCADILLLAGDLTRAGEPEEAAVLVDELAGIGVPVVAVLGNHDLHSDRESEVVEILQLGGITVLEGEAAVFTIGAATLGVAGVTGFGGGFAGRCGSDFGEPEMKAFVRRTVDAAHRLEAALDSLDTDVTVALLHYSPVADTLGREPPEIYPFLGSYLLAEAVDRAGADLVLHGHAHRGSERGITPGGIRVRNVAQPVLGAPFRVFELDAVPRQLRVAPVEGEDGESEDAVLASSGGRDR
jgi:Icc-related predicted phosphoesterase